MSEREARTPAWRSWGDGWHTTELPDGGAIHVHTAIRNGRAVITDLYVHAEEIDSMILRSINTTKIRALAEHQVESDAVRDTAIVDDLPEPSLADLRMRVPLGPLRRASLSRHIEPLTRPTGDDPEAFYARVADAYRHYAATTGRAAAAAIAAEAEVPVSTAHRWVREARRRGHLPPGERGKTG